MIRRTVECYNEEYDNDGYDKNGKYKDQENCKPKVTTAVNKCSRDPPPTPFPVWAIILSVLFGVCLIGAIFGKPVYELIFKDK
jgi:hypothetical protein